MLNRRHFHFDAIGVWTFVSIAILSIPTVLILYYGLAVYRSPAGFGTAVIVSMLLTLLAAGTSTIAVFILFTPAAFHLSRQKNDILETATDIPVSIPHPIIGIALLLLSTKLTPFGRFLNELGINLFYTIQGMIAALIIVSAPIYIRSAQSLFSARSRDSELFAYSMGASRFRYLFSILIPSSSRELLSASLTSMARAISEFGSIAVIAYIVTSPPIFSGTMYMSVLIYQYYNYYGPQVAVTAAAFMIVISIAIPVAVRLLRRGGHSNVH